MDEGNKMQSNLKQIKYSARKIKDIIRQDKEKRAIKIKPHKADELDKVLWDTFNQPHSTYDKIFSEVL